jgi:hypothetical protein
VLLLNPGDQQARIASLVADRVNEAFRGGPGDTPDGSTAIAKNNLAIELHVPPAYRLNMPRYLRVVRFIPLQASPDQPGAKEGDARTYRQRLAEDLLNPARTVTTALRLEAIGQESIPSLKAGLEAKHPLVRFCSAEALAYLDCSAGGEELGRDVAKQPLLRSFALTALASMDESVSRFQLRELLTTSTDPETRYGAFRALRALDENDSLVKGDFLNESFWLHRVAPDAAPLVHVSTTQRAVRRRAETQGAVLIPGWRVRGDGHGGRGSLHREPFPPSRRREARPMLPCAGRGVAEDGGNGRHLSRGNRTGGTGRPL